MGQVVGVFSRMVTASETDENKPLDESMIKEVTGDGTITVRSLHKAPFEFHPQFKLWLATNHKPEIRGTDDGIWRRIMLIPFSAKFYNAEDPNAPIEGPFKDKDMLQKLKAEAKASSDGVFTNGKSKREQCPTAQKPTSGLR